MRRQVQEKKPFSELTKRERFLVDNPKENRNRGYGGYYKWYTVSSAKRYGNMTISSRNRGWFWRDKPKQSRKRK